MNGEEHDTSQYSVVEVIAPSVMMEMEKFLVKPDPQRSEPGESSIDDLSSCRCSLVCLDALSKNVQY